MKPEKLRYSLRVSFLPVKTAFFALMTTTKSPRVDVGGELGLVLAAQEDGGPLGHLADNLVRGVDDKPLALDFGRLCTDRFHR